MVANGLQGGAERADSISQRAISRQNRRAIGAREVDRAGVARRSVIELILGRDGEVESVIDKRARRRAHGEMGRGQRTYQNGIARAGNGGVGGVGRGDRLSAGGLQCGAEGPDSIYKCAVRRQDRLGIAAR